MRFLMDLFTKILDMSITASIVILVVIAARLLLKKAPKAISYALWGVVLLRLLVPFSIPSDISLIPERVGSGELVSELSDIYVGETWIIEDDSPYYDAAVFNGREPVTDESGTYVVAKYDQLGEPETVGNTVMPVLSILWAAGVAGMLIYSVASYIRLRRQLRVAVPVRDNIFIADDIRSPFVIGFIRPRIYLPGNLGDKEREYIILHEQHHIRRCDHIVKLLSFAALSIHWFNPLVWLAFVMASKDMEMSCDEAVIGKMGEEVRADYSASLLTLATGRRIIAGTPLAFGEGDTAGRIKNLSGWKKPVLWVVIAAVIGCGALAVCLLTDRIAEEKLPPIGPRTYTVTEVTYESMLTSFQDVPGVNTPVYTITDGKQLLSRFKDEDWKTLGVLNEFELTKENFDDLLKGQRWSMSGSASSFRRNNAGAWKLVCDQDRLYYILQQKDGEIYLCYGFYDYSEKDDPYSDDTMIYTIYRLSGDISEDMGIVAVSGERSVPVVVFPSNTAVTDVLEEVFWLDIVPGEGEFSPFTMYCDGREILGFFSIYDAETLESLAYFHPSGLSPQTYLFQNAEYGRDYIITMRTSMEEITDMYCFGARLGKPEANDEPGGTTSLLSLNDVIRLSQKGYELTWEDFSGFKYIETGSGLYIHSYYINDLFSLSVGGTGTEGQPMYIYLEAKDGTDDRIDIRDGGVTEFIEKHHNNTPAESHIAAIFSSEMYTWVGYSPEGYSAMVERAENRDTERRYGNIEHLTPVVKLETKREFDDFYREMSAYFQFEQSWVDSGSFSVEAERFDKAFFSENTLFIAYLEEPSTSIRHELEEVRVENGVLEIRICRIRPQAGDTAMAGWFLSVGVPKDTAADCTGYDAYICAEVDPDSVFPSSPLAAYGYDDGDILNSAMVSLYEDGQFQFVFSPLSSYIAIGNYTIENDRLMLHTHDGMFVYAFDMVDDTLVFDAEASTDQVWYSGITDGSVFESYDHTQPTPEGYSENTANHDEITAFCKDAFQEFFRAVKQGDEADLLPYINSDALRLYMEHRVKNHAFAYSAGTRCEFQIIETAACGEYTLVKGQFITYNPSTNSESGEGLATLVVKNDNGKFVITEWYWPFKGSPDEKYRNNFSVEDNLDYWENESKYSDLIASIKV